MAAVDLSRTPFAPLGAHLLDLLHALSGHEIPLILVGGFGLFLRQEHLLVTGSETLFPGVPAARATEDFDALLQLTVLADVEKMRSLRDALTTLGYEVVVGAERYQFFKPDTAGAGRRNVKIDLLARKPEAGDPQLTHDSRRIGPLAKKNPLHAHVTPEAFAVEEGLVQVPLAGNRTDGASSTGAVFLTNPYALYLMKLFAFRDEEEGKKGAGRQDYARKHAQDIATITALLTESESAELPAYRARHLDHVLAQEAAEIVERYFHDEAQAGPLRMTEAGVHQALRNLAHGVLTETFNP
ncbi:hypothetical protein [Armatimonas sp.]|uniref:hypothetical protein n=1 Tax=Armatimonas sp. TaxID=1872638 RepID=UPI00374D8FE3